MPGSSDIDVSAALEVDDLVADLHLRRSCRAARRAAPAADPAPDAHPRPHGIRAGPGRGQPRGRGRSRWSSPATATSPRTPPSGSSSATSRCRAVVGIEAARAGDHARARRRAGQCGRPHGAGARRCRSRDRCGAAPANPRPAGRTIARRRRWRAAACWPDGTPNRRRLRIWSSTQTATGLRAAVAAKLQLDLADVEVITPDVGGGFGVKINHPWPEEVLVAFAARALAPAGEVHRRPPRTFHRVGARARPAASRRGRATTTTGDCSACRCASGTTTAPTFRTGSSCRS